MALWLNKKLTLLLVLVFAKSFVFAQDGAKPPVYPEYKDPKQFEHFRKRRLVVAAWQIHALRDGGALVVKLRTNNILIDQLLKQGKKDLALEKQLEQFAVNRNTMFAYRDNFKFCKVYFIYSNYSDSLLDGKRRDIFLDTNLVVDPTLEMKENFYLIAESDFAYTSSIGFVPEDSARKIKEEGNPIKLMAVVLKNKYGHQLKSPMPYATRDVNFSPTTYALPINYYVTETGLAADILFPVNKTFLYDLKNNPERKATVKHRAGSQGTAVKLKKEFTYEKLSTSISEFNSSLFRTLKEYPKPEMDQISADVKPFLY